ncbi:hypothetical protein ABXT60_04990 [Candidatus Njordibacter sp. Uisw_056]|jgi:hypothetical protein|uniref:hypothetical protein n=1 Tax=Candidatus Njordibacter sp. Uisw_056 TaxID=3230973 RepID=UPI003D476D47|tara:strand:- start:1127 stop:1327 length:201 start_codon:yes stop_codon:yes gene_type:complete
MNDVLLKEQHVCVDLTDMFRPALHFSWGGTIWHHLIAIGTGRVIKDIGLAMQQARYLGKKVRPNTP